jgi:4-amino-4-deoxy-L-arabinose transferase-like glycosyltransferase
MACGNFRIRNADVCLIAIFGLALAVRVWGIPHDLPYNYYPDEKHWVNRTLAFGSGDLNPHWFHKPAFYMYLLFFEYGIFYLVGRSLGWFLTVDDFARHYFTDPSSFFILGRITTTIFGVATVYLTYVIARGYGGRRVGLIAALFLALMLGHVQGSQVVLSDVPTAFWTALSFLYVVKVADTGRTRDYLLAGLFAGLGTATKYYSVILLPSLCLAHFFFYRKEEKISGKMATDANIVAAVICWVAGFFVASPYNFLDPFWFKNSIIPIFTGGTGNAPEVEMYIRRSPDQLPLAVAHIWEVIADPSGMGPIIGALALIGMGYLVVRYSGKNMILLSTVWSFIIIAALVSPFYTQPRHLNPIDPFLSISAAIVTNRVLDQRWLKAKAWARGLICFLLVLPSIYYVVRHNYRISQKETRTLASEWIEKNIPAGTKILLDENGPPLRPSMENLTRLYQEATRETRPGPFTTHLERYVYYQLQAVGGVSYDITDINHAWWQKAESAPGIVEEMTDVDRDMGNPLWKRGVMPFEFYRTNHYQYVITISDDYTRYESESRKAAFPSFHAFYRELFAKGTMVKEFHPDPWKRRGPVVKIFALSVSDTTQMIASH